MNNLNNIDHVSKRLNQLTDLGFVTFTNRFELGGVEIDFMKVHNDTEEEWNNRIKSVLAKAELKKIVEENVAYLDYQETVYYFINNNKEELKKLLNNL